MALDNNGVADMIRDCLMNDTTTLYGAGKLVQKVTSDPSLWENASVNVNGYTVFLLCDESAATEYRLQNHDRQYVVSYRVRGLNVSAETARDAIDDIDHQIELLMNEEMYSGDVFTDYYDDSKAQVYDVAYDRSTLTVETRANEVIAECEGAITVSVNRVR